jgi:hypothetical protein
MHSMFAVDRTADFYEKLLDRFGAFDVSGRRFLHIVLKSSQELRRAF